MRGRILLMQAGYAGPGELRRQAARQAEASLQKAIGINRNLAGQNAEFLAKARTLYN
jgi:hypothetical protein